MAKKKGKRLMSLLAIVFPWLVMIIYDNPAGFFLTLVLQATLIGWIPAAMWAWKVVHEPTDNEEVSVDINTKT